MSAKLGKRTTAWVLAIGALGVFGSPEAALAQGKAKVVAFSKAGNWNINSVYSSTGPFNHCSASAKYRSGTRVAFIAYASGLWRLQFYKKEWPKRPVTKFPAQLDVDGRTVLRGKGFFRGRSAFINLGKSADRVITLMRGRTMSIITPSGKSSFCLDGTFRAATEVAKCWKVKRSTGGGGAFANKNQGAFGGGASSGGAFGGAPAKGRTSAKIGNYILDGMG